MNEVKIFQEGEDYQPSGEVVQFRQKMSDAVQIAKDLIMGGFISPTTYTPTDKEVEDVSVFFDENDLNKVRRQMTLHRTASAVLAAQRLQVPYERIASTIYVYNNIVSVYGPFVYRALNESPKVKNLSWKFEGIPNDLSLVCKAEMEVDGNQVTASYNCQDAISAGSMPFYDPATQQFYKMKSGRNGTYRTTDSWCTNIKMMFQYKVAHYLIKTYLGDLLGGYAMHTEPDASDISSVVVGMTESQSNLPSQSATEPEPNKEVSDAFEQLMNDIEDSIASDSENMDLLEQSSNDLKLKFKESVNDLSNVQVKRYRSLLKSIKDQAGILKTAVAQSVMDEPTEEVATEPEEKEFTSVTNKKQASVEKAEEAQVVDFHRPTGYDEDNGADVMANFNAVKNNFTNPILFKIFCDASPERRQKLWTGWVANKNLIDDTIVPLVHADWKQLYEANK